MINEFPSLSMKQMFILNYLMSKTRSYGLELVKESDGILKRGTVYVTLNRMEEKGFVSSTLKASKGIGGPPRRVYEITGKGAMAFSRWQLLLSKTNPAFAGNL